MGKIKFRLLRNKWIIPSEKTTGLLFSIIKREGADNINRAIEHLEQEGYQPSIVNDISSRITILYLVSLTKKLYVDTKSTKDAKNILEKLIKEVLDV